MASRSLALASSSSRGRAAVAALRQAPVLSRSLATKASPSSAPLSNKPTPPAAPATGTPAKPLDWGTYLSMRNSRRLYGFITTIPTTALALGTSGAYFFSQTVDPSVPQFMGLDPLLICVGSTVACTGLGYLCGPSLGTFIWNTKNRERRAEVEQMDKRFWKHIERNRVDPTAQAGQARLPDYYCEKVSSIPTYRQWLRDQNAFRRKHAHGVKADE